MLISIDTTNNPIRDGGMRMNYPDNFNAHAFDIAFGISDVDTSVSDGLSNMLNAVSYTHLTLPTKA